MWPIEVGPLALPTPGGCASVAGRSANRCRCAFRCVLYGEADHSSDRDNRPGKRSPAHESVIPFTPRGEPGPKEHRAGLRRGNPGRGRPAGRRQDRRADPEQAHNGVGRGHRIVPAGRLRGLGPAGEGRGSGLLEDHRVRARRVRGPAGRAPGELREVHRRAMSSGRSGSTRPTCNVPDGRADDIDRAAVEYERGDPGAGGDRPADPRHRRQRPHRLQRADVVVRVAHAHQDAGPEDPRRQRSLLRQPRPGAHALPDAGARHHPGRDDASLLVAQGESKAAAIAGGRGPAHAMCPARCCSCTRTPRSSSTRRPPAS